jgi:hypothetical protein
MIAFAGSKYRLSTPRTGMVVDDLFKGYFPLGGYPYHFMKKNKAAGLEFARYTAVCGASLNAEEMYTLNLITHVAQEDAQEAIYETYYRSQPYKYDIPVDSRAAVMMRGLFLQLVL